MGSASHDEKFTEKGNAINQKNKNFPQAGGDAVKKKVNEEINSARIVEVFKKNGYVLIVNQQKSIKKKNT